MKFNRLLLGVAVIGLFMTSCTRTVYVHKQKSMPPGHAKKLTGSKSAKPYAPGQQKKHK